MVVDSAGLEETGSKSGMIKKRKCFYKSASCCKCPTPFPNLTRPLFSKLGSLKARNIFVGKHFIDLKKNNRTAVSERNIIKIRPVQY